MRSGVRRARGRRGVVGVRATSVFTSAAPRGGGGGQGGEGALRDAEVPTRDDVEAGHEDDAPRALEADAAVLGGLASGAGRRAVAEVADDVRSRITAHSVDGARTLSQQALDSKGNEQKARVVVEKLSTPRLFELKAPHERALALHESQQRSLPSQTSQQALLRASSPQRKASRGQLLSFWQRSCPCWRSQ